MCREIVIVLLVVGGTTHGQTPQFNYDRDPTSPHGPHAWPVTFAEHCNGQRQSPVDIQTDHVRFVRHQCPRVKYRNKLVPGELKNTGLFGKFEPTTYGKVQLTKVPYQKGVYKFLDFHAHHGGMKPTPINASELFAGAEHTINGLKFDGEVHLVFFNKKYRNLTEASHHTDGIAVIGIFVQIVPEDKLLDPRFSAFLEQHYPQISNFDAKIKATLDITMFLERNCGFYTYKGSLTTPFCNESVTWMVLRDPIYVSKKAWDHCVSLPSRGGFNEVFGNYRNTMPTNVRIIEANFLSAKPRLPIAQSEKPRRNPRPSPTNIKGRKKSQAQGPIQQPHDSILQAQMSFGRMQLPVKAQSQSGQAKSQPELPGVTTLHKPSIQQNEQKHQQSLPLVEDFPSLQHLLPNLLKQPIHHIKALLSFPDNGHQPGVAQRLDPFFADSGHQSGVAQRLDPSFPDSGHQSGVSQRRLDLPFFGGSRHQQGASQQLERLVQARRRIDADIQRLASLSNKSPKLPVVQVPRAGAINGQYYRDLQIQEPHHTQTQWHQNPTRNAHRLSGALRHDSRKDRLRNERLSSGQLTQSNIPYDWLPPSPAAANRSVSEQPAEPVALEKYIAYDRRGNMIAHTLRIGREDRPSHGELIRRINMASRFAKMKANGRFRVYT